MASETKKLKSLLHESIENIEDDELLRFAKDILDRKYVPVTDVKLNEYQADRIKKAKKDIAKGDYLSGEQADELVSKWLNE